MKAKKDTKKSLKIQAGKIMDNEKMSMPEKMRRIEELQRRFMKVS